MPTHDFTRTYVNTWPASGNQGTLYLRGAPATMKHGDLTVKPVLVNGDSAFGAEIEGVDWSQAIPEELVRQVRC
jgi:alpha-ketoglutarate-dependent 2,4-dichlorophenoxyacetate dioxygenase